MTTIGISYPKQYLEELLNIETGTYQNESIPVSDVLGLAFKFNPANPFNLDISQFVLTRGLKFQVRLVKLDWFSPDNQRLHDYTEESITSPPLLEEVRGDQHRLEFIENNEEQQRVRVEHDPITGLSEVSEIEEIERQTVPKSNSEDDTTQPHLIFFSKEEIKSLIEVSDEYILFSTILTRYGKMAIHEPIDKPNVIGLKMEADRPIYEGENIVSGGYNGVDCPPKWPRFLYGILFQNIFYLDNRFYRTFYRFTPPILQPLLDNVFDFFADRARLEQNLRVRLFDQFRNSIQETLPVVVE